MRPTTPPAQPHIGALIDGQIWTFRDELLEIRKVGKLLVQISRTRQPGPGFKGKVKRASSRYESVRSVLEILNTQQARLKPAGIVES